MSITGLWRLFWATGNIELFLALRELERDTRERTAP